MAKADETPDFEPSELGTKEYWENTYAKELRTFHDIGDVGEICSKVLENTTVIKQQATRGPTTQAKICGFGEDSQERVVDWLDDSDAVSKDDTVLDLGCGNGALLLELRQRGFRDLTGMDYVQDALDLARGVLAEQGFTDVCLQAGDLTSDLSSLPASSCLRQQYRVCVDKGTFDAISLTPGRAAEGKEAYRQNVKNLLQPGGVLVLTSCNWTKDELLQFFQPDFKLMDEIRTPSFQFGGQVGRSVTSLIFAPS